MFKITKQAENDYFVSDGHRWLLTDGTATKSCDRVDTHRYLYYFKSEELARRAIETYNNNKDKVMKFEIITKVDYNEDGHSFFVYYIVDKKTSYSYLHKNGAYYSDCIGPNKTHTKPLKNLTDYLNLGGYYETKKEAQIFLDKYNKPKLTLEERVEALEKKLELVQNK